MQGVGSGRLGGERVHRTVGQPDLTDDGVAGHTGHQPGARVVGRGHRPGGDVGPEPLAHLLVVAHVGHQALGPGHHGHERIGPLDPTGPGAGWPGVADRSRELAIDELGLGLGAR